MDKYRNVWPRRQAFSGQTELRIRYFNKWIIATPRIHSGGVGMEIPVQNKTYLPVLSTLAAKGGREWPLGSRTSLPPPRASPIPP